MFLRYDHKLLAIDDLYRDTHLLPNGQSKTLWIGVQISQWYECNDICFHGDVEKWIIRRKKNKSDVKWNKVELIENIVCPS